jgi:hypothetical protein
LTFSEKAFLSVLHIFFIVEEKKKIVKTWIFVYKKKEKLTQASMFAPLSGFGSFSNQNISALKLNF